MDTLEYILPCLKRKKNTERYFIVLEVSYLTIKIIHLYQYFLENLFFHSFHTMYNHL
jgi:hypothetical protein